MITKDLFLKALASNKAVRAQDLDLLTAWLALPDRTATAEQVVEVTGAKRASLIVNNLGKRIAGFLEIEPEAGNAVSTIALEGSVGDDVAWVLRDELAQALMENSGTNASEVVPTTKASVNPEETPEALEPFDGGKGSLDVALLEFDRTVVRAVYPNTPGENRLLTPEMVSQLVSKRPDNKRTYQREIPSTLRGKVSTQESKRFLDQVLEILKRNS